MNKHELDPIVKAIIEADPHLTLREIAELVFTTTQYNPSPSVIKYSLERQGYSTGGKARKWAFVNGKVAE